MTPCLTLYTSSGAILCSSVSLMKDMLVERVGSVSCRAVWRGGGPGTHKERRGAG